MPVDLIARPLPANASRYEWSRATLPTAELKTFWAAWVALAGLSSVFSAAIIYAILRSRRARSHNYLITIVCWVFPDWFFSFFCAIQCLMHVLYSDPDAGVFFGGDSFCDFQAFFVMFGFCCSIWMSCMMAMDLYSKLLAASKLARFERTTFMQLVKRTISVYVGSAIVSLLPIFGVLHVRVNMVAGLACLPSPHDLTSELVFWLVIFTLVLGIPCVIITYIVVDVWRRNMLKSMHPVERRLAALFARILLVLLVMWVPTFVCMWVLGVHDNMVYVGYAGGVWSHLQGIITALIFATNREIQLLLIQAFGLQRCCGKVPRDFLTKKARRSTWRRRQSQKAATKLAMDETMRSTDMRRCCCYCSLGGYFSKAGQSTRGSEVMAENEEGRGSGLGGSRVEASTFAVSSYQEEPTYSYETAVADEDESVWTVTSSKGCDVPPVSKYVVKVDAAP